MNTPTEEFDRAFWEDRYAGSDLTWSGRPNASLVAEVADIAPGTALDIGSGEGGDAIWLAAGGWRVTGVDISQNALDTARGQAEAAGTEIADRISWEQHDLTEWDPPIAAFDLVSAQFMHLAEPARSRLFRALAEAVAPGGTLLIVGHDLGEESETEHGDHHRHLMFGADEVARTVGEAGLNIVIAQTRERPATDANGHHRDVIVRAVRAVATP